jgi:hypothetical protein
MSDLPEESRPRRKLSAAERLKLLRALGKHGLLPLQLPELQTPRSRTKRKRLKSTDDAQPWVPRPPRSRSD